MVGALPVLGPSRGHPLTSGLILLSVSSQHPRASLGPHYYQLKPFSSFRVSSTQPASHSGSRGWKPALESSIHMANASLAKSDAQPLLRLSSWALVLICSLTPSAECISQSSPVPRHPGGGAPSEGPTQMPLSLGTLCVVVRSVCCISNCLCLILAKLLTTSVWPQANCVNCQFFVYKTGIIVIVISVFSIWLFLSSETLFCWCDIVTLSKITRVCIIFMSRLRSVI